jgi:hypothetical protein
MKFLLKYKNIEVLKIDLLLYPEGLQVLDFWVLNKNMLPIGLKPFLDVIYDKMMQSYLLTEWLMKRSIPDYRNNIDDFVLSIHQLPRHLFGRMNGYQHTAALLSYMASGFDHYILTPEKQEIIYFGKQDGRFISLYNLLPKSEYENKELKSTQSINNYIYKQVSKAYSYDGCFPTDSFTIPSGVPSWWEYRNDRKILIQKCDREYDKNRAKALITLLDSYKIPGERTFVGTYMITDLNDISKYEVTWLGEFIPYLKDADKVHIQLKIIIEEFGFGDILDQLLPISKEMRKQGFDIGMQEMGIVHTQKEVFPIIIL